MDRKIKIQMSKWADVVLNPPDIVIFPKNESKFQKPVIEKLKSKPCLVIAYAEGLAAAGASINFFVADGKIKFEVNTKSLKESSLSIDPTLLKLAKVIP